MGLLTLFLEKKESVFYILNFELESKAASRLRRYLIFNMKPILLRAYSIYNRVRSPSLFIINNCSFFFFLIQFDILEIDASG